MQKIVEPKSSNTILGVPPQNRRGYGASSRTLNLRAQQGKHPDNDSHMPRLTLPIRKTIKSPRVILGIKPSRATNLRNHLVPDIKLGD